MQIALLGYGTVGSAVARVLLENQKIIRARCGEEIKPIIALTKSPKKQALIPITQDLGAVLEREDIDVYVELMGGVEEPFRIVRELLKRGKNVVTANKAMLAYHRYELEALAENLAFGYEASVAGGIPIIKALKEGLAANNILSIKGILNGTSNYILSAMQGGMSFEAALKKAQNLGYAEANPCFDVGGMDAAHKLLILSSLAYGIRALPEEILCEGIEGIGAEDMYFAREFDLCIKLLGVAKAKGYEVELRVHPAMISKDTMIAKVDGVMNAVSIVGDMLGESLYYGAGAGGEATASAVVANLMEIARKELQSPMLGFKNPSSYTLLEREKIYTKYYLRLKVEDRIGVLSKITNLMSENNISIDSFLQKPKADGDYCTLFFTTHKSYEKSIQTLLQILKKQEFIKDEPFRMRIED
ncbi:homoserine dehydrogenase [Campylobacter sp.]|uniref:homoserine dehydrogenase n=1 Tax=Campylobacter sp. TaxID=205 RepID=UPI0026DAE614|nr:homoserine dehydrogenase [Campylobacter sp.]MDO4673606.1 homoserine dehydrogenase [Campylobacter sp.]